MRFRTHMLSSLALGLAIYPRRPARLAAVVAAGTLIDVDHYVMYCLRTGDWSLTGALRYDRYRHHGAGEGDSRPRYGPLRSWLHNPPLALAAVVAWGARDSRAWPVALGLGLHLLLDLADWPAHYRAARRAGGVCEGCGRRRHLVVLRGGTRGAYTYKALCPTCLEQVTRGRSPGAHLSRGRRGRSAVPPVVH